MLSRMLHQCLILLLFLSLGGCSATRLAYQNADWLIERGLQEYVDFNGDQSRQLDDALARHMKWHCQTQLPLYIEWLDRVKQTATTTPMDSVAVSHRVDELGNFLQDIAYEITPTASALLSQLSDRQVRDMQENMAKRQQELEEKHLKPSVEEQISRRAERLEKRLKRWLGALTAEQRARIRAWSEAQPDRNRQWLESRRRWQTALLNIAESRQEPEFSDNVAALLQCPGRFHPPEWKINNVAYHTASVGLATDLLQMTTNEQKRHLLQAITKLQKDFTALTCQ